ncbi:MAG: serine/threonine protein kinase [Clostridiales bacterium]|nr:serine/threonine protein kinase [Clostridiales bacterium]
MARVRTNKNICLYCFGDLDGNRTCMSCHRKADDTPSPPHHLPQRTVLGTQNRYLIGKALGEGGFGITYLAWDLQQGIKVAVKEYFPSGYVTRVAGSNQVIINSKQNQAASNRGLKRFVEEARALAKIKNLSGVVNVRDFFSANGTAYIVMEFLDGISLKKYLQRKGGKLSVDEILTIMHPVMDSLVQVHKIGLIHRDISPDNILITKQNEVKLIDFGAAKYSNTDGKSLSVVLKQGFAPPEQYDSHGEQGPWTDVYALGVTIYFAITGVLPPESIRVMMGKEDIRRPSELGVAIDPGVENGLMKSLAVDKKKRHQDVTSMINGLYNPRSPRKTVTVSPTPTTTVEKPNQKVIIPRTAAGATSTTAPAEKSALKKPASRAVTTPPTPTTAPATKPAATAKPTATTKPASATATTTKPEVKPAATAKQTAAQTTTTATKPTATATATKTATTTAAKTTATKPTPAAKPNGTGTAASKPTTTTPKTASPVTRSRSSSFLSKLFKK